MYNRYSAEDYIVDEWTPVVLTSLGNVKSLEFQMSSSDNDPIFGMNTPAYFAIDNINEQDDDGDGYSEVEGDCDDSDPGVHPGAEEICGDNIDQDCSGYDLSCDDAWFEGCFINVTKGSM